MENDKPVSVILNAAADDLEVNGWQQGPKGVTPEGPHCALGAIASVVGRTADEVIAALRAAALIAQARETHPSDEAVSAS